ncbi:hypothetical protein ACIPSE_44760 [Streptomyces sp. NPDC090106]|uniref:hypothetical protein n=1 Tax=Streptomyces sp. NPDC090106 TaxID=3365946 RepID=UPI0038020F2B
MDRITAIVLDLLFDLTQQTARWATDPTPHGCPTTPDPLPPPQQAAPSGASTDPWGALATYDTDAYALFLGTQPARRCDGPVHPAAPLHPSQTIHPT